MLNLNNCLKFINTCRGDRTFILTFSRGPEADSSKLEKYDLANSGTGTQLGARSCRAVITTLWLEFCLVPPKANYCIVRWLRLLTHSRWLPYQYQCQTHQRCFITFILVPPTPLLLNSARLHRASQNFVVPWKIQTSQKLIISSEAPPRGASNGAWFAYVNYYYIWVMRQGQR